MDGIHLTIIDRLKVAKLPKREDTLSIYDDRVIIQKPRSYIGMSGLAGDCTTKIWLTWRWASYDKLPARVQRIFDRGNLEEERIIKDLKYAGVEVVNEQAECVGFEGYVLGHIDCELKGVVESPKTTHLGEFKTMNDKLFKVLQKKGTEESNPVYYGQSQIYMKYRKLRRALFVVTNKNDEARYHERIYYNHEYADALDERGRQIALSETPPVKPFGPSFYKCGWCKHGEVCHAGAAPEKNCRTCKSFDLIGGGKYACARNGAELSYEKQVSACRLYSRLF